MSCKCKENGLAKCPEHAPPVGSWASVAMLMASIPQDPNEPPMDWDAWKEEMKENEEI